MRRRRGGMLDPEKKDLTTTQLITANNAGTITLLNGIQQGVDVSDRQGRRALFLSVFVKYCVTLDVANQSPQCYRIALVQDRFPQGQFPALGQIWTSIGSVQAPMGMRTLSIVNRFKILGQRLLQLDQGNLAKRGKMFVRLRMSALYGSAGAAIADLGLNALFLVLVSDQAGGGGAEPPIYAGLVRVRFTG